MGHVSTSIRRNTIKGQQVRNIRRSTLPRLIVTQKMLTMTNRMTTSHSRAKGLLTRSPRVKVRHHGRNLRRRSTMSTHNFSRHANFAHVKNRQLLTRRVFTTTRTRSTLQHVRNIKQNSVSNVSRQATNRLFRQNRHVQGPILHNRNINHDLVTQASHHHLRTHVLPNTNGRPINSGTHTSRSRAGLSFRAGTIGVLLWDAFMGPKLHVPQIVTLSSVTRTPLFMRPNIVNTRMRFTRSNTTNIFNHAIRRRPSMNISTRVFNSVRNTNPQPRIRTTSGIVNSRPNAPHQLTTQRRRMPLQGQAYNTSDITSTILVGGKPRFKPTNQGVTSHNVHRFKIFPSKSSFRNQAIVSP